MDAFLAFLMSPAFLTGVGSVVTVLAPIIAHGNGVNLGWLSSLLTLIGVAPGTPSPTPAPTPTSSSTLGTVLAEVFALLDAPPMPAVPLTPVTPSVPTPGSPAVVSPLDALTNSRVAQLQTALSSGGPLRNFIRGVVAKTHNLPVTAPAVAA